MARVAIDHAVNHEKTEQQSWTAGRMTPGTEQGLGAWEERRYNMLAQRPRTIVAQE